MLSFLGFAALVGAIFGLIQLVRDRGVILGHVGGWLAAFGAIAFVGLVTTTFYDLSIAENAPLALGERISEGVEDYEGALVVLLPAIIGLPVGLILLTLSLHRRRLAPIWVPVVIAAAAVVLTVGGDSKVAGVVGSLLFLAGLGYLGLTVLRMTDHEWAGAPPPVPAP